MLPTPPPRKVFYGWWLVSGGMVIQVLIGGLIFHTFGVYAAELRDQFGWSKTTLSGAFAMTRAESGMLGPLQGWAIDRFGPPPEAAKSLFRISKLQLYCQAMGIRRFTLDQNGGRIEFNPQPTINPGPLLQLMADEPGVFRMADGHSVQVRKPLEEHSARLEFAEKLLARLAIE